jgi:hypothetical protein
MLMIQFNIITKKHHMICGRMYINYDKYHKKKSFRRIYKSVDGVDCMQLAMQVPMINPQPNWIYPWPEKYLGT